MNITNSDLAELLSLYSCGKQNEAQTTLLRSWAKQSSQNRQILELLDGTSHFGVDISQMLDYDQERVWSAICRSHRASSRKRTLQRITRMCVAAVLVSVVILVVIFNRNDTPMKNEIVSVVSPGVKGAVLEMSSGETIDLANLAGRSLTESDLTQIEISNGQTSFKSNPKPVAKPVMNTVSAPCGAEYSLTLSDGTQVWLNSDSKITFPTQFTGNYRQVVVSGEVYFEVAHDSKHPFIVSSGDVKMTVRGTSFNIASYPETRSVITTLISGALEVSVDNQPPSSGVALNPGQQTNYDVDKQQISVRKVYADHYAAWTKGLFVFFDEPVESLCQKLARWYRIDIVADPAQLEGICLSGVIKKEETFNKVAEILAATEEIVFIEKQGRFEVRAVNSPKM